jgi:general secretion pathway protein E
MIEVPTNLKPYMRLDIKRGRVRVDASSHRRGDIQTFINSIKRHHGDGLRVECVDLAKLSQYNDIGMNEVLTGDSLLVNRQAVHDLVREAASYCTSDIHLVVGESHTSIQLEVDGALRQLPSVTRHKGIAMVRTIYQAMASVSDASFMPSSFQNASVPGDEFDESLGIAGIRIQRGPCYPYDKAAEFMTLRLQYRGGGRRGNTRVCPYPFPESPSSQINLETLGYDKKQVRMIHELLSMPDGVTLVTGPVGSGKSTLIFNMLVLKLQAQPYLRLVTVEDPIEVAIPGAVQLAVQNVHSEQARGLEYHKVLSVMLRMAPRWMFFGELRDEKVAHVALEAAVSGHGILTTLHVSDPFQWADRLAGMSQSGLLSKASFCDHRQVRGIIGQRLLGVLCPSCAQVATADLSVNRLADHPHQAAYRVIQGNVLQALATWGDIAAVRFRGHGCAECGGSGVRGRVAVAEIILTDALLMRDLVNLGALQARIHHQQRESADLPMIERAIGLALQGIVDPMEVIERVDSIRPKDTLTQSADAFEPAARYAHNARNSLIAANPVIPRLLS